MSEMPVTAGMSIGDVVGQDRAAAVHEIAKVDREQRCAWADESRACVARVEPHVGGGDDVLPAMLLELVD
jgi:hypothetical protein